MCFKDYRQKVFLCNTNLKDSPKYIWPKTKKNHFIFYRNYWVSFLSQRSSFKNLTFYVSKFVEEVFTKMNIRSNAIFFFKTTCNFITIKMNKYETWKRHIHGFVMLTHNSKSVCRSRQIELCPKVMRKNVVSHINVTVCLATGLSSKNEV